MTSYIRTPEHRERQAKLMVEAWAHRRKHGTPCLPGCTCAKHKVKEKRCPPDCRCDRHKGFLGGSEGDYYAALLTPLGYVREHKVWVRQPGQRHYNLDFALVQEKVNIELDGPLHYGAFDDLRDERLRALGWKVIRVQHD